jgi:hypothetical protein
MDAVVDRERKRDPHRCPACQAAFDVAYFDDRQDERADQGLVTVEVACPSCGKSKVATVPAGAEKTLLVEIDELEDTDEGAGG